MGHDSREAVRHIPKLLWGMEGPEGRERGKERKNQSGAEAAADRDCTTSQATGDMQSLSLALVPLVGGFGFYYYYFDGGQGGTNTFDAAGSEDHRGPNPDQPRVRLTE